MDEVARTAQRSYSPPTVDDRGTPALPDIVGRQLDADFTLATEDEAGREAGEAVADAVAAAEDGPAYNSRWPLAGKEMVAGARAEVVAAHSRIFSRGSLPTQRGFLVAGPRL